MAIPQRPAAERPGFKQWALQNKKVILTNKYVWLAAVLVPSAAFYLIQLRPHFKQARIDHLHEEVRQLYERRENENRK